MTPSKTKTGRGKSWTGPELNRMLSAVEEILPLGGSEWESVAARYGKVLPREFSERDVDAIKRKFLALKNSLKPTGDPACPEEVGRAKRAYYKMESRSGVESFEDTTTAEPPVAATVIAETSSTENTATAATSSPSPTPFVETSTPTHSVAEGSSDREPAARSASKRCGKTPSQLAELSDELRRGRASVEGVAVSHTVKRRRTIDNLLSKLENENGGGNDMIQATVAMEERAAARELEYRRERDEREAKREEREQRREEMFLVLMAKLLGDKVGTASRLSNNTSL